MLKNPFTPTFGSVPLLLAGREKPIADVIEGLDNSPGDPNRATIYTGPRGSGKTVLLRKIEEEAQQIGWISVGVTAIPGLLKKITQKVRIAASDFITEPSKSRITSIRVSGTGFTREFVHQDELDWELQMDIILGELNEQGIGLLITVDEASASVPELIELIAAFQHFVGQKRDIALIMAGLPQQIDQLFMNESVSFLRRALRRPLGTLNASDVRYIIKKTIELSGKSIEEKALDAAADASGGLPIMVQLIGYHIWREASGDVIKLDDIKGGVSSARLDLRHMVLDTVLFDLTETERSFLDAMLMDKGASAIGDIALRMGTSRNNATNYRRRLLDKGIISSKSRGKVSFAMPMLKELLEEELGD